MMQIMMSPPGGYRITQEPKADYYSGGGAGGRGGGGSYINSNIPKNTREKFEHHSIYKITQWLYNDMVDRH